MIFDPIPFRKFVYQLKENQQLLDDLAEAQINKITDRHLARIKKNTAVGDSPDSPTLSSRWDRSGVHFMSDGVYAEVFNPTKYAAYYEYGHRQAPGRIIFIELRAGQEKYGYPAQLVKKGKHAGKWGIFLKLVKPFVKGSFVMTNSEAKAQRELDAAAKKISRAIEHSL